MSHRRPTPAVARTMLPRRFGFGFQGAPAAVARHVADHHPHIRLAAIFPAIHPPVQRTLPADRQPLPPVGGFTQQATITHLRRRTLGHRAGNRLEDWTDAIDARHGTFIGRCRRPAPLSDTLSQSPGGMAATTSGIFFRIAWSPPAHPAAPLYHDPRDCGSAARIPAST